MGIQLNKNNNYIKNNIGQAEGRKDAGKNPFMPTAGAFNICCPRDCVSRHNGGTSGAPLKPLRVDSALRKHYTLLDHIIKIYFIE